MTTMIVPATRQGAPAFRFLSLYLQLQKEDVELYDGQPPGTS